MYLNFAEGVHIDDLSGHARTGVILSPSAAPSEWHKRISEILACLVQGRKTYEP